MVVDPGRALEAGDVAMAAPVEVQPVARPGLRHLWVASIATFVGVLHPLRHRPMSLLIYSQAVLLVALTVLTVVPAIPAGTAPLTGVGIVAVIALAVLVGCFGGLAVLTTAGRWCWLRRAARRGVRLWVATDVAGRTRASAVVAPDRARADHGRVRDFAAYPQGTGTGRQLMAAVCADADFSGQTLHLKATNRAIAGWYTRYGFQPVAATTGWGGQMTRAPRSDSPAA